MPERRSKRQRYQSSEQGLEFFRRDPNGFLWRLVTMDETWLYHYDSETKQQSMEWRHSGSPRPKTASSTLIIFQRAKLSTWSITHLVQLKDILKEKRRGKVTKGVSFLHSNALAHQTLATQKKLVYLGFQCLDHSPYSPDLAPSDYHLFPGLKKTIKGHHFSSDAEVIASAETWLDR